MHINTLIHVSDKKTYLTQSKEENIRGIAPRIIGYLKDQGALHTSAPFLIPFPAAAADRRQHVQRALAPAHCLFSESSMDAAFASRSSALNSIFTVPGSTTGSPFAKPESVSFSGGSTSGVSFAPARSAADAIAFLLHCGDCLKVQPLVRSGVRMRAALFGTAASAAPSMRARLPATSLSCPTQFSIDPLLSPAPEPAPASTFFAQPRRLFSPASVIGVGMALSCGDSSGRRGRPGPAGRDGRRTMSQALQMSWTRAFTSLIRSSAQLTSRSTCSQCFLSISSSRVSLHRARRNPYPGGKPYVVVSRRVKGFCAKTEGGVVCVAYLDCLAWPARLGHDETALSRTSGTRFC
jgi:hypothetical protein